MMSHTMIEVRIARAVLTDEIAASLALGADEVRARNSGVAAFTDTLKMLREQDRPLVLPRFRPMGEKKC